MIELIVDRSQTRRSGADVRLRVPSRSTVRDLQSSIAIKIGIEPDQQYLEFNDQTLTDRPNERLSSLGISNLSLILVEDRGSF